MIQNSNHVNGQKVNGMPVQGAETKDKVRDELGWFKVGNPGGPGNPFARRVGDLRKAMLAAVSEEDMAEIARALVRKAKEGHVQAAKLVMSYALGKPPAATDTDRLDTHEWEIERETAAMMPELAKIMKEPPAEVPLRTVRVMRPVMGSLMSKGIVAAGTKPVKTRPSANGDFGVERVREGAGFPGGLDALAPDRIDAGAWLTERFGAMPSGNGQQTGK